MLARYRAYGLFAGQRLTRFGDFAYAPVGWAGLSAERLTRRGDNGRFVSFGVDAHRSHMTAPELAVAGNPGIVLARVAPTLLSWLGADGCVLGGGTVLAARWRHRVSTDGWRGRTRR